MGEYVHGASKDEQARLEGQARMFGGASFLPPLRPDTRLLELGCGTGAIGRIVARELPAGGVTGLDRQALQIEKARGLAEAEGLRNLTFVVGEVSSLEVEPGSFDGAYCRYFLEHLEDPAAVVRAMARAVRPGGFVCAYEWENACFTSYPECPAVLEVWAAACRLQGELGGNGHMGRELYRVFVEAGLPEVEVSCHAFALTAASRQDLASYAAGAREILAQMREGLLGRGLVTAETLARAEAEYAALISHPHALCIEVMCRAFSRVGPA